MSQLPIVCLMGPTASGKTDLAVSLVQRLPCAIVSVDSSLVYRHMDIGTAKPCKEILARAPHRLINLCDVTEPYSVARFYDDVQQAIIEIQNAQKIPLLVGGTMLYFKALQQGLAALPAASPAIRARLLQLSQERGWPYLHQQLQAVDSVAAEKINYNDGQRIQRALEVYELTGQPVSSFWQKQDISSPHRFLNIVLNPDRQCLHQRINERLQTMWQQDFIGEVAVFYERADCHPIPSPLKAVGYRQVWQYLAGEIEKSSLEEKALYATRQFAKRQLTWLRTWPDAVYLESYGATQVETLCQMICEQIVL